MKLTAVFQKTREGHIGFVEELPGANTQARTLKQARVNLAEAVELVLQANRSLSKKSVGKKKVIREPLVLAIVRRWAPFDGAGTARQRRTSARYP